MHSLTKDDSSLIANAKRHWYVPYPNKTCDFGKLGEKELLKELDGYKQAKKKLKMFQLEVVRAGSKKVWQEGDYQVIITVA